MRQRRRRAELAPPAATAQRPEGRYAGRAGPDRALQYVADSWKIQQELVKLQRECVLEPEADLMKLWGIRSGIRTLVPDA